MKYYSLQDVNKTNETLQETFSRYILLYFFSESLAYSKLQEWSLSFQASDVLCFGQFY